MSSGVARFPQTAEAHQIIEDRDGLVVRSFFIEHMTQGGEGVLDRLANGRSQVRRRGHGRNGDCDRDGHPQLNDGARAAEHVRGRRGRAAPRLATRNRRRSLPKSDGGDQNSPTRASRSFAGPSGGTGLIPRGSAARLPGDTLADPHCHMVYMIRIRSVPLLAAVVVPITMAWTTEAPRPSPRLIVVITIDQFRADYLARWQTQWRGGFRRLLAEGAVFQNGRQDHALTETASGHSTILSGRDPAHTGITVNALGVPDSAFPVLGFPDVMGASPNRFVGTTLVDWMRHEDSSLRWLSVSGKDRAAMLSIGRSKGPVFWYRGGRFTTSRYYAESLPAWLMGWNARAGAVHLAGKVWSLARPDTAYAEIDSEPYENEGRDFVFPHRLPTDGVRAARALPSYPWLDSLTLDVALAGTSALGLGQREKPDLLAISLSATDYIGHAFGPDSREIHDQLLRLDGWLGWFLDSLAELVPPDGLVVVVTADHGVTSYPEFAVAHGRPAGRVPLGIVVREANLAIGRRAGHSTFLHEGSGLIYGDTARLRSIGVSPESLATALAPRVWRLPGVANAWTPATLGAASPNDVDAVRWWRALPAKFSWLVAASVKPGYIWAEEVGSAQHGTTNPEDVNVPIVFLGAGFQPGLYPDTVRTTDIAPTLARLLDVKPEEKLDGRPIKKALR